MLRKRDRHIGRRKKALRHLLNARVALRDQILQGAYAVDHRVGFSAGHGAKRVRHMTDRHCHRPTRVYRAQTRSVLKRSRRASGISLSVQLCSGPAAHREANVDCRTADQS